jgi:protein-tyrosine phosphatase
VPTSAPFRVAFVCTGNICRSPMAEIVFRDFAERAGLGDYVSSSSSGTGDWHVGERADAAPSRRCTAAATTASAIAPASSRSTTSTATTSSSPSTVRTSASSRAGRARRRRRQARAALSFDAAADGNLDVPDPYYAGPEMFDEVLGMIECEPGALPAARTRHPPVLGLT